MQTIHTSITNASQTGWNNFRYGTGATLFIQTLVMKLTKYYFCWKILMHILKPSLKMEIYRYKWYNEIILEQFLVKSYKTKLSWYRDVATNTRWRNFCVLMINVQQIGGNSSIIISGFNFHNRQKFWPEKLVAIIYNVNVFNMMPFIIWFSRFYLT